MSGAKDCGSSLGADSAKMLDNVSPWGGPSVIAWPSVEHHCHYWPSSLAIWSQRTTHSADPWPSSIGKTVRDELRVAALSCWILEWAGTHCTLKNILTMAWLLIPLKAMLMPVVWAAPCRHVVSEGLIAMGTMLIQGICTATQGQDAVYSYGPDPLSSQRVESASWVLPH